MAGMVLNLVRLVFLLLLIAVVVLFILAKSGVAKKEEDGTLAEAEQAVPFDTVDGPRIESLRKAGMELVLLSFLNEEQDRVVPKSPARIEMRDLELVTAKREDGTEYYSGWKYSASVVKEIEVEGDIADAEMGWLFSKELLTVLRDIRRERLTREAQQQKQVKELARRK